MKSLVLIHNNYIIYVDVEWYVMYSSSAVIEVNCEVIQSNLLLQKLAEIMLQQIAASSLLQKLWYREKPRHLIYGTRWWFGCCSVVRLV